MELVVILVVETGSSGLKQVHVADLDLYSRCHFGNEHKRALKREWVFHKFALTAGEIATYWCDVTLPFIDSSEATYSLLQLAGCKENK